MTFFFANLFCVLPAVLGQTTDCTKPNGLAEVIQELRSQSSGFDTQKTRDSRSAHIEKTQLKQPRKRTFRPGRKPSRSSASGRITQKVTPPPSTVKSIVQKTQEQGKADGIKTASAAPKTAPSQSEFDRILDGLQAYYRQQKDLKADFVQTYTYVKMGRKKVSTGRVFFKTPHRMRFDYQTPARKLIISDGQTLWIYEPDQFQAFRRNLKGSQLPVAMTFMSGQGDLRAEFTGQIISQNNESAIIELVPRKNEGDYQSLRLDIDAQTFAVRSSTVVDPVGNLNEIRFKNLQANTNLPEAGFRFQVPEGVSVVE